MNEPLTIESFVISGKHIYIEWSISSGCVVDWYEIERQIFNSDDWKVLVGGVWLDTGIADQLTNINHFDRDVGSDIYQYRVRSYKTVDGYSDYKYSGVSSLGSDQLQGIGYSFKNYVVPSGKWGVLGTGDDLRYTYLYGINLKAQNGQEFDNKQLEFYIDSAVEDFERYLGIIIKRRRYITQPLDSLVQVVDWIESCSYTHEEDPYPFDPDAWRDGYGQMKLLHFPVIKLHRAKLYTETDAELLDMIDTEWVRLDKKSGIISFFPKVGVEAMGPFVRGGLYLRSLYRHGYPHGFKFDYDAGYKTSDFVPAGLREIILTWASIKALASTGDGLLAGFSSSSISLDGLSESFSSTQSATSAYFGARIKQYRDQVKEWCKNNRYKYNNIPLGFV